MIKSTIELQGMEPQPNSELKTRLSTSAPDIGNTNVVCQGGKFGYCQSQIEGSKYCKKQCDHCKEYYAPLEERLVVRRLLEKKLKRIEKELDGCRTSVMQDGWQTQRYAKKARKWDILAQEKFKIQSQLEEL